MCTIIWYPRVLNILGIFVKYWWIKISTIVVWNKTQRIEILDHRIWFQNDEHSKWFQTKTWLSPVAPEQGGPLGGPGFSPPKILDFISKKYKLAPQNFQKSMFSPPTSEYLPAPLLCSMLSKYLCLPWHLIKTHVWYDSFNIWMNKLQNFDCVYTQLQLFSVAFPTVVLEAGRMQKEESQSPCEGHKYLAKIVNKLSS